MYRRLLLGCDGGIIDNIQRSEQDDSAVICIGLGGTGINCLETIKKEIYNRIISDDPDASVPVYSHIKFLAVDSDHLAVRQASENDPYFTEIDRNTEFFDLSYKGDLFGLIKQYGVLFESMPEYREWLRYKDISVFRPTAGSGGIRQIGRYMLMEKAWDFLNRLNSLVIQAMTGVDSHKLYIHIFSGLSGGTGGGALLDICYLIRELLSRYNASSYVCGYFFLPDIQIDAGMSRQESDHIRMNGYAALKELDHCMNFGANRDHWEQSYRGIGTIISDKPPVDICHLISARDICGNIIRNAYKHTMNVVADYVIYYITKNQNSFTMESNISAYTGIKSRICKEYGTGREYCVLGAASASLPLREVLTYLAAGMFEQIGTVRNIVPSRAQLDDFINENGLSYKEIFGQLIEGANMNFPIPDIRWKDAARNSELTIDFYRGIEAKAESVIETNYQELIRDLDPEYSAVQRSADQRRSIIETVFDSLVSISLDPDRGPFFASDLLSNSTHSDLIEIIDKYLRSVRHKTDQENEQESSLIPLFEKSQREFFEKPNKKKYQIYTNAARDLVIHYTRLTCFRQMEGLLIRVRKQLTDLACEFMDVFCKTIDELIDTFRENGNYLDSLAYYHAYRDYEQPLITIAELKESLDKTVSGIDMPSRITEFMRIMLNGDGIKAWISGDENEIFRIVNRYFTTIFSYYSGKTITGYLQEKYDTTNPDQLTQHIRNDIMNTLDSKAAPLLWSSNDYDLNSAASRGFIIYPYQAGEVGAAARRLESSKTPGELIVRESFINDRISVLKWMIGVPLYGYQGMWEYESLSAKSTDAGRYIYEGKSYTNDNGEHVAGRDWRDLHLTVPYNLKSNNTSEEISQ